MKKWGKLAVLTALLLALPSCAKDAIDLPAPQSVYAEIASSVDMPEMVEMTADEMADYLGLEASDYSDFAYYTCLIATQPDEVAVIAAVDGGAAGRVKQKLQDRLDYKEKSAENYLPENIPIIKKAIIRQDGLTASMLVSADAEDMAAVYSSF
ncbi:MAG: DUF4358 domain-containing protein [Oscillospiraceae bacterium]|nr:DUF4358 domain-containing protein [Oscillospiraceae bacterium]